MLMFIRLQIDIEYLGIDLASLQAVLLLCFIGTYFSFVANFASFSSFYKDMK